MSAPRVGAKGRMGGVYLIAGGNRPVAADFASHASRQGWRTVTGHDLSQPGRRIDGVVVFLDRNGGPRQRAELEATVALARGRGVRRVCLVSTFRVHFGDRQAAQIEADALRLFEDTVAHLTVLRP